MTQKHMLWLLALVAAYFLWKKGSTPAEVINPNMPRTNVEQNPPSSTDEVLNFVIQNQSDT